MVTAHVAGSVRIRRWMRFSLRTLIVGVAIVAIWLGWWVNSARRKSKPSLRFSRTTAPSNTTTSATPRQIDGYPRASPLVRFGCKDFSATTTFMMS